jgi:hypothetical protein
MQGLRKALFSRPLVWYLALAMMLISSVPRNADAGLITSQMAADGSRQANIAKVQAALESKIVSQRLVDLGLNPEEVKAKVATFSDEDLHQLASNVDQLQGGGDGLGVVIALLVIVLLIIIIIQVSGHKIVITK